MYAVLAVTYYFIDFFLSLLVATRLARRRFIGAALVHRGDNGLLTFSGLQFDNGPAYGPKVTEVRSSELDKGAGGMHE